MNKRLHMAAAFVILMGLGGVAAAQNVRLPIPGEPINPTSREQCQAMSQEWSAIWQEYSRQHEECLKSQACKNSSGNDTGGQCSCGACLRVHLIRDRYSTGDLAQIRKQRMDDCNRKVAAYEANQRQQRQAAQEDQRARQQAANQAAQQYADAQRQYADMQRRQREHQNAVTAQQLENQRRNVERLQQQQERSQQAMAALSSMFARGSESERSSSSSAQPLPDRPTSAIGTTLYSASQMVNLASQAKEDIGATMSAMTLAFSSNPQSRSEAASNLADYASSKATDAAATGLTNTIIALMPRRNDHQDAGFSEFFEAVQSNTIGRATYSPGIQFIQNVTAGVLESQLQQTLGDMAQLERDINSFSAGSPSYYSSTRSFGSGSGSSGNSTSNFSPPRSSSGNSTANISAPSGNQDLAREEVEALRQGLRYAMTETQVSSPSLIRFIGADNAIENRPATASCNDRARGVVADGRQICREGRALVCRAGQFQPSGGSC